MASQGWELTKTYVDDGYTGTNLRRPAMQKLLQDAQGRAFDVVLVWRLDRLSRRQLDVLRVIEDALAPAGIGFRSATEAFDTTTPYGMAMLGMLATFAQLEHAVILERTALGVRRRLSEGKWTGTTPYGYRYGADGVLEPNPETADHARQIFRDVVDGFGMKAIAASLNEHGVPAARYGSRWHAGAVSLIVRNRAYIGEQRASGDWRPGSHVPLIEEGLWHRAQAVVRARRLGDGRATRGQPSAYLLTGLLVCPECGRSMFGFSVKKKDEPAKRYYTCQRTRSGKACGAGWARMEKVEASVLERLFRFDVETDRPTFENGDEVAAALAEVVQRIQRLVAAVEDGLLPAAEVRERMDALQGERAELEAKRARVEMASSSRADAEEAIARVRDIPLLWPHMAHADRQRMLRAVVDHITVFKNAPPVIRVRS